MTDWKLVEKLVSERDDLQAQVERLEHYKHMIDFTIEFAPPHISDEVKAELKRLEYRLQAKAEGENQ